MAVYPMVVNVGVIGEYYYCPGSWWVGHYAGGGNTGGSVDRDGHNGCGPPSQWNSNSNGWNVYFPTLTSPTLVVVYVPDDADGQYGIQFQSNEPTGDPFYPYALYNGLFTFDINNPPPGAFPPPCATAA